MYKKLLSFLLIITMAVSLFVPTSVMADSSSGEIVVFEDDFEKGNMFLRILPDWVHANGELISPLSVGANSWLENKADVSYRDYTVEAVFAMQQWNFTANTTWTGIIMRENLCFYFKPKGENTSLCEVRCWDMTAGKDIGLSECNIELGVDYRVKITAKDKFIQVQLKKESEEFYLDLGTYTDMTMNKGHYYWRAMASIVKVKEVKVSVPASNNLIFTKYGYAEIGENEIQFKNTENIPVTFTVSDSSKAEITSDGKLNIKAKGTFVVTASNAEGVVLDKAVYSGGIYVNAIDFAMGKRDMYVGDTMDVRAYYSPTNADFKKTTWESSDPSVVEIVGKGERIGVRALKPGTSVITAKLAYGGALRDTAWLTLTVLPKVDPGEGSASFAVTGQKHEIPEYFFGLALGDRAYTKDKTFNYDEASDVINDIGYKITRLPGGGSSCYFDWRTGTSSNISYAADWKGYTMEEVYKEANEAGVPAVYSLNTSSKYNSVQDIIDCITEIKKNTNYPIFLELNNETYAASANWPQEWQTVDGFVDSMDVYYSAIKEAHPDVLVAGTALSKEMEKRILADPNNSAFENPDDWEYTTPGRVYYWNEKVAKGDSYDTVTTHPYTHQTQVTCTTQDEYMKNHFAFAQDNYLNILMTSRQFNNKKVWVTEWGDIAEEMMGNKDTEIKGRMQTDWDVGVAISEGERLMNMLKTGVVDMTVYWDITGSSGFGIAPFWADGTLNTYMTKQSRYYLFKELGKILNGNTHYHDLIPVECGFETMPWPWSNGSPHVVNLEDVSVHGVGSADKVKNVVIVNHTKKDMTVSIDGLKIKKQVSWGGPDDVFVDYMVKANRNHTTGYRDDQVVKPTYYENASFEDSVVLPGFTFLIAEVEGDAVINTDTIAGKVSKITEYELMHTVVLKPGKNTAYVNNRKTAVDEDVNVKPQIKNGRTLLPLRFVSENMGATVDYEDATKKITVTLGDIVAKFQVGSVTYYVNDEVKTLDVPAEVEYGRTLIPLRALAEAIGKTVYWDDRGLIVVSNVSTSFHDEPYTEAQPEYMTEILALFDGQN